MVSGAQHLIRPAYVNSYSVAGLSIDIESDEAWVQDAFDRQFSGSHFLPAATSERRSARIRVFDSAAPLLPAGLERFEVAHRGHCSTDGSSYHITYDDSLVSFDDSVPAEVQVWAGASSRSGPALTRLFFTAAAVAIRHCGFYEVHAGCVVEPAGRRGALVIGPSGSGKSTVTAHLASLGWGYLSDDSLLLNARDGGVQVYGVRRVFTLTDQAIEAGDLRNLKSSIANPNTVTQTKRRLDPFAVFPEQFVESCLPSLLLFSSVTNEADSRVERVTQSEAMSKLIRLCPWASYDRTVGRRYLETLALLVKQCRAFRLQMGRDLFGDSAKTASIIGDLF